MTGFRGHAKAVAARGVASPNLVPGTAREMISYAPAIWTEAEAVGESLVRAGKSARIRAVEVHAEDLADLVADDLDQHPAVGEQQLRGVEDRHPVARRDFLERAGINIINPKMSRGLRIILVERASGSIPPFFHAEQDQATAVREEAAGLPGFLVGRIELEVTQAGAVAVDQRSLSLRHEANPGGAPLAFT
jgi:hypothetical protein